MSAFADLLFYTAIALCCAGVLLNAEYVVKLPGRMPRGSRWPVMVWLVMLFGLASWGRSYSDTGVTTVTGVDSSAIVQILSIVIAGLTLLVMAGRCFNSRDFHAPFVLLCIFGLVGVFTAPLSTFAALSLFKASSVVVAVILAAMAIKPLVDSRNPALLYNTVYIYFALISFLAVVGGVLHPAYTRMASPGVFGFMLKGWPALNPNSVSYVGAVVLVISLRRMFSATSFRQRLLYFGIGSTGAIALVLAQGRTSLFSSFLAVIFMVFFIKEMRRFRYAALAASLLLLILFILTGTVGGWVDGLGEYLRRGVDDEDLSTLSGRTEAWSVSWNLFLQSPLSGYGFYAAGKTLLAPHSAYFTVLLNVGLLGFLPWLIGVIGGMWVIFSRIFRRSWRKPTAQNSMYMELLAVMMIQFVRTVTGQDLTIHSYSMLLFLSALVYVYAREKVIRFDAPERPAPESNASLPGDRNSVALRSPRILQARRRGNSAIKVKLP